MSKARHEKKCRAAGGGVDDKDAKPMKVGAEGNTKVIAEAGKTDVGAIGGEKAKKRADRPARATGGRVATATSPMSMAAKGN